MYWAKQRTQLKETWPYFRPKKFQFSLLFSDVASKVHTARQKFCQRIRICLFFLIHLELKRQIRVMRSYTPVIRSNTIPDFKPKWAKCISVFNRPKKPKNHTLWGGTYLYGFHKETSPGRKSKYLKKFCPRAWVPSKCFIWPWDETLWKGKNWFEGLITKQCRDR